MQILRKFWEKRKSDKNSNRNLEIFCDFEEFWVNYKEFLENYSGNYKLTMKKFQRIKKS